MKVTTLTISRMRLAVVEAFIWLCTPSSELSPYKTQKSKLIHYQLPMSLFLSLCVCEFGSSRYKWDHIIFALLWLTYFT